MRFYFLLQLSLAIALLLSPLLAQDVAKEWDAMDSTQRRIVLETRDYGISVGYRELGAHAGHESRGDTTAWNLESKKDPYDDCVCELQVAVRFPTERSHGKNFTYLEFIAVADSLITDREF